MSRTATFITPHDHGRRMTLDDFESAEVQDGHLYELSGGTIIVSDIPGDQHWAQVDEIKQQLYVYKAANPSQVHRVGGGAECKILLIDTESERHPDVAVYKQAKPEGANFWARWIPAVAIEVVSESSRHRDYDEKPADYLAFGVLEYWIVDFKNDEMVVMQRSGGRWATRAVKPGERYRTALLPGFELNLEAVFNAARLARE
jgi:Uma2 family endonuclease